VIATTAADQQGIGRASRSAAIRGGSGPGWRGRLGAGSGNRSDQASRHILFHKCNVV